MLLGKISEYPTAEKLKTHLTKVAHERNDEWGGEVLGRLEHANDLVASQMVYHLRCKTNFDNESRRQNNKFVDSNLTDECPKFLLFLIFTIFFTAMNSADFCEIRVHSPPIYNMNEHNEFNTYRLEPIGNNNRASWTKIGKSSTNFTFSDFHDSFNVDIFSGFLCNSVPWSTYTI